MKAHYNLSNHDFYESTKNQHFLTRAPFLPRAPQALDGTEFLFNSKIYVQDNQADNETMQRVDD